MEIFGGKFAFVLCWNAVLQFCLAEFIISINEDFENRLKGFKAAIKTAAAERKAGDVWFATDHRQAKINGKLKNRIV